MTQFLKILKAIPAVLARIAHVIEHMFCDEVPSIDEDLFLSESRSFSDLDSGPADYPCDEEDDS